MEATASGGVVPEMGTRKLGMGAIIGRPDDLSAIYHNPAGLVLSPGINIYLGAGLSLVDTELQLRPWEGSERYIHEPVGDDGYYPVFSPSRAFGVIPMLVGSVSLLSDDLVIAAGLFVPNAIGAAFDEDSVARYHLVESYFLTGSASVAAAWRPMPWVAVGATVSVLYIRARVERLLFPTLGGLDLAGVFGGDSRLVLEGADVSAGGTLGLMFWPLPGVSFGLVMITRTDFTLQGDLAVHLGPSTGRDGSSLTGSGRTAMMLPWTVQAGINWDMTRWIELAFELRYYFFSQQQDVRVQVEGIPLLSELVTPRESHNSVHLGGGVRVSPPLRGLELMAGYHYDMSPARDSQVSMEQPSFSYHGMRLGVRYRALQALRLSLTYVHYWYMSRSTDRNAASPPSNYRGGGVNHIMSLVAELRFRSPGAGR